MMREQHGPLACSVRGCGLPLDRSGRTFVCPRRHSHDIARSGYVNLLQPQDRRSAAAGDRRPALEARRRLIEAGTGRAALDALVTRAASLDLAAGAVVVDLGCGSGEALAALAATSQVAGIGIDLSVDAIAMAARRFPGPQWVVANADRRLPLADRSVALVVSLHGRRNAAECARVLAASGSLLVAVPAPDDLIELRELVQGQAVERSRAETLLAEHDAAFELIDRQTIRERHHLDRSQIHDLLTGTYRGARRRDAARVETLADLEVTIASELLLFRMK